MKKWFKKKYELFVSHRKRLNDTVSYVKRTNCIPRIVIVFDIFYSFLFYGCTINEYKIFDFFEIPNDLKKSYLTISKHNSLCAGSIKKSKGKFTRNKIYDKFNDYIIRETKKIKDLSFKEFEVLALDKKILLFTDNNDKNKVCVMNLKDFRSPAFMLDKANKSSYEYVEEYKKQNKVFDNINPYGLTIISVVTILNNNDIDIISSSIKLIMENNTIETIIEDGITKYPFIDRDDNIYREINNEKLLNIKIPKYNEVIKKAKTLAKQIPEVKEVEWLFLINDDVELLGCGPWKNYLFAQKKIFLNGREGLYSYYKKIKGRI